MIKGIMEELAGMDLDNTHPALVSHILDAINSAILIIDDHDRLILANSRAEQMLGKGVLKQGEKPLEKIFMPEDREILLYNVLKITRAQREFEGEVMLKRSDSSTFIALMATSAWPWKDGQAVVFTIHDISKLKGIEKLLRNSERMAFLGSMLDDISHQIRNPVLAIGGFSRRLAKTPQEKPEYLAAITEEASRLEELLNSLTDFIRLPPQTPRHVPLPEIIAGIKLVLSDLASEYGMELEFRPTAPLPDEPAFLDIDALLKAVQAVAQNCADETISTDSLRMTIRLEACQLPAMCGVLRIIDNGQGIRPQLLSRIFNPFFTTKTGHTGMGLTLARRIIQEASGILKVESTFGQGTTATIYLPRDRRREIRRKRLSDSLEQTR